MRAVDAMDGLIDARIDALGVRRLGGGCRCFACMTAWRRLLLVRRLTGGLHKDRTVDDCSYGYCNSEDCETVLVGGKCSSKR
jgi:hypothetical protein